MKRTIPFSGPYASYLTTMSVLNLQFLLSTQFTDQDALDWGVSLRDDLKEINFKSVVDPILEHLTQTPIFILNEIWLSSISSTIINFTSTTEHYLKDIINLSLIRNASLRKQAFNEINISALDLENNTSLDAIKKKYISMISVDKSKGELFTIKFERASKFLAIDKSLHDKKLYSMLDSIWQLRNDIAHSNKMFKKMYQLQGRTGPFQLTNEPDKKEYFAFAIQLLEVINEFTEFLKIWDNCALDTWPASDFIN